MAREWGVSKECNVKSNICAFVFRQTTSCHQRIVCVAVINQAHVCNLYPFIRNIWRDKEEEDISNHLMYNGSDVFHS